MTPNTKLQCRPIVKAVISFIAKNAICAVQNMLVRLRTESKTGSSIIFLALRTIPIMTMVRHFTSHYLTSSPEFTMYVLEYIKTTKCILRSNTIRKIAWIHRLNTLIPTGLNILN